MVSQEVLDQLKDFGIRESHGRILLALNKEGRMRKRDLMEKTGFTAPVVEDAANAFEDVGWLRKTNEPRDEDGRGRPYRVYEFTTSLPEALDDILQGMEQHARDIENEVE